MTPIRGRSRGTAIPRLPRMNAAMTFRRPRSGTLLVGGMVAFGVLLTATLYGYWSLHTAPFRPLTDALAERFPGSAPRVDGGKPRLDRPGDRILRVVMKVGFDPNRDDARATAFADEVRAFVAGRQVLTGFDVLELHLFSPAPGVEPSQRTFVSRVEDIER